MINWTNRRCPACNGRGLMEGILTLGGHNGSARRGWCRECSRCGWWEILPLGTETEDDRDRRRPA
jgi:hypothetical protein